MKMERRFQEFFWTPAEFCLWLVDVCNEREFWLVIWPVGGNAKVVDVNTIGQELFTLTSHQACQLFVGSAENEIVWRYTSNIKELDYSKSYAVQFIPPKIVLDKNILLQGRMAMFPKAEYPDSDKADYVQTVFSYLRKSMMQRSLQGKKIAQKLTSGQTKVWKDILVGSGAATGGLALKQFEDGPVVFEII